MIKEKELTIKYIDHSDEIAKGDAQELHNLAFNIQARVLENFGRIESVEDMDRVLSIMAELISVVRILEEGDRFNNKTE